MIRNQSGQITVDFLFALILTLGVFVLIFAMTFTMSVVEVVQYITYSSARAMIASNKDPETQLEAARRKYSLLVGEGSPARGFLQGWYAVSSPGELDIRTGVDRDFSADLGGGEDPRGVFMGVSTRFVAKILNLSVPFLGSSSDGEEGSFATRISTILIRESSQKECHTWYDQRVQAIGSLRASQAPYFKSEEVKRMEDNGC